MRARWNTHYEKNLTAYNKNKNNKCRAAFHNSASVPVLQLLISWDLLQLQNKYLGCLTLFVKLEPADKSLWIHVLETKIPCLPQTNCATYQVKQVSSCSMPLEKPINQNNKIKFLYKDNTILTILNYWPCKQRVTNATPWM